MRDPRRSVRPCKQMKQTRGKAVSLLHACRSLFHEYICICMCFLILHVHAVRSSSSIGTLLVRSFSEEEEDLLIKLHALLGNRYEERAMVLSCSTQLYALLSSTMLILAQLSDLISSSSVVQYLSSAHVARTFTCTYILQQCRVELQFERFRLVL